MHAFVSHWSALEALRARGANFRTWPAEPRMLPMVGDCIYRQRDVAKLRDEVDFASLGIVSRPVDLLIPDKTYRRVGKQARTHLWGSVVPAGSFLRIDRQVLVSGPEFCLLQLANVRAPKAGGDAVDDSWARDAATVRLTVTTMELLGSYRLSPYEGGLTSYGKAPLSTSDELASFVRRACDPLVLPRTAHGVPKVPFGYRYSTAINTIRSVIDLAVEGAASPVETALVLMLTLPQSLGGFGLPKPVLNQPVLGVGERVTPDLMWPDKRVVVEYDSEEFHASLGRDKTNRDIMRANVLRAQGFRVLEVTPGIAYDEVRMRALALQLARALGEPVPIAATARNCALHRLLFLG